MQFLKKCTLILVLFTGINMMYAQQKADIPAVYSRISYDEEGNLSLQVKDETFTASTYTPRYSLQQLYGNPVGTENGLIFNFGDLEGTLTYGLIPYGKVKHPLPIFRFTKPIVKLYCCRV